MVFFKWKNETSEAKPHAQCKFYHNFFIYIMINVVRKLNTISIVINICVFSKWFTGLFILRVVLKFQWSKIKRAIYSSVLFSISFTNRNSYNCKVKKFVKIFGFYGWVYFGWITNEIWFFWRKKNPRKSVPHWS